MTGEIESLKNFFRRQYPYRIINYRIKKFDLTGIIILSKLLTETGKTFNRISYISRPNKALKPTESVIIKCAGQE